MSTRFEELRTVIRRLRDENGCPWDRAQTFESLKPCMMDEMTEALAGIDLYHQTGDAENLCEELGDVLLQIMLLSDIAEEEKLFTIDDVLDGITEKMIRRHPHVFAGQTVKSREDQLVQWKAIKDMERRNKDSEAQALEKAAFSRAAGQVLLHLDNKLKKSQ